MSSTPLPESWVDRIFSRFTAMFGSQKVATMWAGVPVEEVKAVWAQALGTYDAATIGKAMQAVLDSGKEWPPTLPEFKALCRQFRDPSHTPAALPAPGGTIDPEVGRRALAALRVVGKRDAA